jgi:hypothetical protein
MIMTELEQYTFSTRTLDFGWRICAGGCSRPRTPIPLFGTAAAAAAAAERYDGGWDGVGWDSMNAFAQIKQQKDARDLSSANKRSAYMRDATRWKCALRVRHFKFCVGLVRHGRWLEFVECIVTETFGSE